MARWRPGHTAVAIACGCLARRTGETRRPAGKEDTGHELHSVQLRHAGRIIMESRRIVGLCRKGIAHSACRSPLPLNPWHLCEDRLQTDAPPNQDEPRNQRKLDEISGAYRPHAARSLCMSRTWSK